MSIKKSPEILERHLGKSAITLTLIAAPLATLSSPALATGVLAVGSSFALGVGAKTIGERIGAMVDDKLKLTDGLAKVLNPLIEKRRSAKGADKTKVVESTNPVDLPETDALVESKKKKRLKFGISL